MPTAKKQAPAVRPAPQPISWRAVPDSLGKGRVSLYDARGGLPELLETPDKGARWVLVHFPSRRHRTAKGKDAALEILRKIHKGEDELEILPPLPPKKKAKTRDGKPPGTPARATKETAEIPPPPPAPAPPPTVPEAQAGAPPRIPGTDGVSTTPVPEGMTFQQAMEHVFPIQRITEDLERLLEASTPVVDKEGDVVGSKPDYMTRMAALRLLIEHVQGRPSEKAKPPPEKKRISYQELEHMLKTSPAARQVMRGLLEEAEKQPQQPPPPAVAPVTPPPPHD